MTNVRSDRVEEKLNALSEAVRAVTAELSLDRVLRRMAEIAARLVSARYAALGVPDEKGNLEQFFTHGMSEQALSRMDHLPIGRGLLGVLLHSEEPIRLEDLTKDSRSAGFCNHHPKMTSFLGVPIISKGRRLGSLYLCDRLDGEPFSEDDENMIELLAAHAAIAIENAQLSEQLTRLAVIEERDRISMELHDGIIQSIYAIGIKLELTRLTLVKNPEVESQIIAANQDLNKVIEDLRSYIHDLRTGMDYNIALRQQFEEIAEGFRQVSGARLVMDLARAFVQLNEPRLHALTQIMREALSNIVRHAHATEVYLDMHETATHLTLVISDNGQGFEPDKVTRGDGLRNIRRRAEQFGGTVEIISQPGRGATLTARIPLPRHVDTPTTKSGS